MSLDKNIQYIKGVGEARAKILNKLGIYTLEDLITYYPRDYEDRGKAKLISEVEDGEEALIKAYPLSAMQVIRTRNKNMTICRIVVRDETGSCEITWYNQPYLKARLKMGKEYSFFGKVTKQAGRTRMVSPVFDEEGLQNNTRKNNTNLSANIWNITKPNKKSNRKRTKLS